VNLFSYGEGLYVFIYGIVCGIMAQFGRKIKQEIPGVSSKSQYKSKKSALIWNGEEFGSC